MSMIQVPAGSVSGEDLLPNLGVAAFLLFPLVVERHALIPVWRAPPSGPDYLPKPLLNIITLGSGLQHKNSGRKQTLNP